MPSEQLFGLDAERVWDTESAFQHLQSLGRADSKRTAERLLHTIGLLPDELTSEQLRDEKDIAPTRSVLDWDIERARARRDLVLFAQLHTLPGNTPCLHLNDARGARYWVPLAQETTEHIIAALAQLQSLLGKTLAVFPHGQLTHHLRREPTVEQVKIHLLAYAPVLDIQLGHHQPASVRTPHLQRLEAESIYILREAVAEAQNPAMLYSIGKDSSVMLHLARKAFYPAPPPFPLLHVDTRWKFREMYLLRDQMAAESGMELHVYTNPEAIAKNINPFDHGSALHTTLPKPKV